MLKRTNPAALILALIAVIIASSGTAMAVTSSVFVADPTHPTQRVHVDAAGRLQTADPLSGVNSAFYLSAGSSPNFMNAPTRATLAVTRINLGNTALNASLPNTDFMVYLYQYTVGADGTCGTGSPGSVMSRTRVPVASDLQLLFPTPLVFKPKAGKAYCIALQVSGEAGTPSSYYLPFGQVTGYVAGGTYASPAFAKVASTRSPLVKPGARRPAGVSPIR